MRSGSLRAADGPRPPAKPAAGRPALDPSHRRRIETVAYWLDERFRIPGTGMRVGLDGLAGLIPGVGDAAATLVSLYIVAEAYRARVPGRVIARMLGNVGIDFAVGSIPLVGDVFDFAFKANRRNLRILLDHLDDVETPARAER